MSRLFLAAYDAEDFQQGGTTFEEIRRRFPEDLWAPRCELFMLTTRAREPDPARAWRLADSVEAASRSLKSPSKESLKKVITDIVSNYIEDGQLDECDFSIRELRAAAAAFMTILYAVYHPRVHYPGFEFEVPKGKKPAKAAGHDRNR